MKNRMSPCGVDCGACEYYPNDCGGCFAIKGKVFWTEFVGADICPIYDCAVNDKELKHCGGCNELPCRRYFDNADPAYTEEEHIADTNRRVILLKKIHEGENARR